MEESNQKDPVNKFAGCKPHPKTLFQGDMVCVQLIFIHLVMDRLWLNDTDSLSYPKSRYAIASKKQRVNRLNISFVVPIKNIHLLRNIPK